LDNNYEADQESLLKILPQNKNKEKKGHLPEAMLDENRYLAARTVGDVWICYPWEATDIEEHDELAKKATAAQ
jgi:hypoxanthine phosphoribosyltransferase